MSWLGAALYETAEHPHPESLATFRAHIDPAWIEEALRVSGIVTLRRRRLPPELVIWLVLGMALMRDRPIREVATKLELVLPDKNDSEVAPSAITGARKRVGEEPLQWLFERCAKEWAHKSARARSWRGLSLYGIDGSTLRVADSEPNRDHFGLATGHRGESGYPLVQLTALMALRSHLLAGARFGPYAESEHSQAADLWDEIPERSVTVLDKNYLSASLLVTVHGVRMGSWHDVVASA